ncbi:MAG: radical SAM protein [Ignavibacteria bacterium CG_4_8_14_3_um_filter_37_9]|nr:radical SAM/Cys-rich domain protein [Ignavibacteria bacterium]OIO18312.1 MAG: radical SAM protein [Ignavibacteria bacterium CG1_02_37_35]PIS45828.1 MAG: radical SAM protein [Ignavibacteria bacterium CG08_land_8_20_14_0_20_37_9]PIW98859.1 MAG: radical SAM protein [Ignavibacteria bacterium CG_4_8_14_3_um_filter_37_9]PIX94961.1 MAG: radical SAM protein [Ignavibacteria bacterium CG_4_10_14_3_um_filter_37_18]PJC61032.1 MAG: radical SAM protein [Ignavibacteria bacterium CG_4_9_14_0_2_um_filter_37
MRENFTQKIAERKHNFEDILRESKLELPPLSIETLQVNITLKCNQACLHCHVDSSPIRTEQMSKETVDKCLGILKDHPQIKNIDITGGAPELNPHFDYLVSEAKKLGKHVLVRHNLTVTIDGDQTSKASKMYLPKFYAEHGVEVISSLPYYQEYFTDKQRGKGVFQKSIQSMKMLNEVGYGDEKSGLILDLVYNPVGAFLPASQETLEKDYKEELWKNFGLKFTNLYTITNMPIHRFKEQLERHGTYDEYMEKLINAFNPSAAMGVMCRSLLSVSYDGKIFDCDFNQMLGMQVFIEKPRTVLDFDYEKLVKRNIIFDSHCFGCTAGAGSSCGGAISE